MKQLSYWASCNVISARWMIAGCYILANLLGDTWALLLYASGKKIPDGVSAGIVLLAAAALFLHPKKHRNKSRHYTYALHKGCDLILCIVTVALVAFVTSGAIRSAVTPAQASFRFHKQTRAELSGNGTDKAQGVSATLRNLKHRYEELPIWGKVSLVILTISVTVILCIFWAGICCEISCGGAEALVAILLFLGWGGLITGCVFLARRIIKGPKFSGPRILNKD